MRAGATFRNSKVAATLKQGRQVGVQCGEFAFRNSKVAATLKPIVIPDALGGEIPSATLKLRPH